MGSMVLRNHLQFDITLMGFITVEGLFSVLSSSPLQSCSSAYYEEGSSKLPH